MSLFIIDTNILTHLQEGDSEISRRVRPFSAGELGISIISVEEDLGGWYTLLRKSHIAHKPDRKARVYAKFTKSINLMKLFKVYSYTEKAMGRYKELSQAGYNISGNDLRIAAIAMEFELVLVTRNTQHFHRIDGLDIEVW